MLNQIALCKFSLIKTPTLNRINFFPCYCCHFQFQDFDQQVEAREGDIIQL